MGDYGERFDEHALRFERLLPGPIERVWAYLTESDKRRQWLAAGVTDLRVGGRTEMHFHNASLSTRPDDEAPEKYRDMPERQSFGGEVTRCEPPRLLAWTWEFEERASEVTFELEPRGDRVLLVLTHRALSDHEELIGTAGGWHAHLDILEDVLAGIEPRPFWKTHTPLEAEYEHRFA
jgi:uncharacterized protein YndB with AHSA1/START domain